MKWLSPFKGSSKQAHEGGGGEVQRSSMSGSTASMQTGTGAMSRSGSQQSQQLSHRTSSNRNFSLFHKHTKPIPHIHECSYKGDVAGVLEAITKGVDVNLMIDMENRGGSPLRGVTPLFLAAQRSKNEVVKLLVENGADPSHRVYFVDSKEYCTPAQVATLNLNLGSAMYLKRAASKFVKGEGAHGMRAASVAYPEAPFSPENYNTLSGASVTLGADERGRALPGSGHHRTVHAEDPAQMPTDGDHNEERPSAPGDDIHIPENSSEASEFLQTYEHEPDPDTVERTSKSVYFNLGFGMSRRTEDGLGSSRRWNPDEGETRTGDAQQRNEGIDLNVKGLNSRADHLRSLLSQPAYEAMP